MVATPLKRADGATCLIEGACCRREASLRAFWRAVAD
jgi:hypothetical protein